MNATHLDILNTQQLMAWALLFIAILTFMSVVIAVWVGFLVRSTSRSLSQSLERVEESAERIEESFERLGHYLFSKFGPADIK
jgi:hypothetical protein